MATPDLLTAAEQYLIEMINRARIDPLAEAARYGIDLNEGLSAGTLGSEQRGVLAPNILLNTAAEGHSQWMLDTDTFSHTGNGGSTSHQRMEAAGYNFTGAWTSGENIAFTGSTGSIDLNVEIVQQHEGLFLSSGHRVNILNAAFREIGVAEVAGQFTSAGVTYNTAMTTENFAASGNNLFLTGVAYSDTDNNDFYSIGEGVGGVSVTVEGSTMQTLSAGGYGVAVAPNTAAEVTVANATNSFDMTVDMSNGNVKLDLVDGARLLTTGSVQLSAQSSDATLELLGNLDMDLGAADGNDTLLGNAGDNGLSGGAGGDLLQGQSGDDTLAGGGAEDLVFGEAGFDAAANQVYRLYQATLDREPDRLGHDAWTSQLLSGTSTSADAAAGFTNSAEFQTTYGALDDTGFVTLLYNNVLKRIPDTAGLNAWVSTLSSGAADRAAVVLGFSDSAEFILRSATEAASYIAEGRAGTWADDIFRLYHATLGRDPDMAGLAGWADILAEGTSFLSVVSGFTNSIEFQNTYGALDDTAFVTLLYQNVLNRAPDSAGLSLWVDLLGNATQTRAEVVEGFAQSEEFVISSQSSVLTFLRQTPGNVLEGGAGDDVLIGGLSADTFTFSAADAGSDTVLGLDAWDIIDLTDFAYTDATAARAQMVETGDNVVFADGSVTVTFADISLAEITDSMLSL